ncbi:3-phenylpropionate/trans-cinnamate dioxygenase ferredoxin reductase subunit [Palleronia marisminoris]|uniref:Rhodocoxin reductase n=1 Tax=Palleronia marisminoris TaxID=315423 RepID=A0A1Y5SZF6_9RHOB|nr:FAD-dependent oxidoreductase [Palleronia marisminoris]SFH08513.1 3-phenylpropionate/trans-cinnamate dioxygenase ferredoxin reductase subunit [Palleronia marisminoris]SLN52242.1 Rhodocoxin reductase [Palleronia marisminoris]
MSHIVVVGAGQAGQQICATLRDKGFDGRLTLIGAEPHPPYQRPPLSKGYLLGEMARERLFLKPEAWYADHGIDLRLGTPATDIDPDARTLRLGDEVVHWDQLAIATGLDARTVSADAGGDLDGVFTVRNLADVDRMEAPLKAARNVVVVGGGYIGLEAAAVARKLGAEVTVVEAGQRILGRVASVETAGVMRDLHARNGVTIREDARLDRLVGEGRVTAAHLESGEELPADVVIVGIGLVPRCEIAAMAGLDCDGGVVVDACGRTSAPDIWAAGDCALFPYRGSLTRLESVQNAIDMGQAVARNMLGTEEPYSPLPWFWSDQYDVKLQIAGLNTGYDRVVMRGAGQVPVSLWYFCGDELRAVDSIGDGRAYMVGKRLLESGARVTPEEVADPDTDLKALLKR